MRCVEQSRIRNFSIVAHIDHGKSTLADRILQLTGAVSEREMREQMLDSMDLERERGITIKAQAVRVPWTYEGELYELNLIDTPGHVDFSYEVSRSLAACEGAILVVDAAQGLEAQTLANAHLAIDNDLEIVPVLNKIDLPAADPDEVATQVVDFLGGSVDDVLRISAKTGVGVGEVLDAVCARIPPPAGDLDGAGARARLRLRLRPVPRRDRVRARRRRRDRDRRRDRRPAERNAHAARGDRRHDAQPCSRSRTARGRRGRLHRDGHQGRLRGARRRHLHARPRAARPSRCPATSTSSRWSSPASSRPTPTATRTCATRSRSCSLNDASLVYEPETSQALGFGFRCGFLGLLHMDVVRERLEREFDLDLLVTTPNVAYEVETTHGLVEVHNPSQMPDANAIVETREPYVKASLIVPKEFVGTVMELAQERRGEFDHMEYLSPTRVQILYELPLAEIVLDFYDQLKSRTQGLRLVRLRALGLPRLEPRQARHPAQRRSGRRAQPDRAPRPRLRGGQGRSSTACAR